jgi:site-specific recombinase XerD
MRFVSGQAPEALALTSHVLAIPLKRFDRRLIQPLSAPEVEAILDATDPATPGGRRDHLLLSLLYHTGARISEALQLRPQDIHWGPPSVVCFHGKGRKERSVPLLQPLAKEFKRMLNQSPKEPSALILENRLGQTLTRSGVEKRLNQTVRRAAQQCLSLKARTVSPHTFRQYAGFRNMPGGTVFP